MKNIYKLITLFFLFSFTKETFAQKVMNVYVHSLVVTGLSTGCDGDTWYTTNKEEPRWYFTNNYQSNDPCWEESQNNAGTVTYTKNGSGDIISNIVRDCEYDAFPTNYQARCRACENDGASCWTASICDGAEADIYSTVINLETLEASGNGDYYYPSASTYYTGTGGCGATYKYRLRINISGSYSTTPRGTTNARDNICNRQDLGTLASSTTYNGATGNVSSYSSENYCNIQEPNQSAMNRSMWYKFTLNGSTPPASFSFDADGGGVACFNSADVHLYRGPASLTCSGTPNGFPPNISPYANPFSNLTNDIDGGTDGYEVVNCPPAGQTYYLQVSDASICNNDINSVQIITGASSAPDDICNALQIGPVAATGIAINTNYETATRYSNVCATNNTGGHNDPTNADGNDGTVWFKFFTPPAIANTPADYYIEVRDPATFSLTGGIEFEVYELTGTACLATPGLSYVGSYDPFGCDDEGGTNFCLKPNKTYYIMVDAEGDGACSGSQRGEFKVKVTGNNRPKAADICTDAISLGTLTPGGTIGNASGSSKWNNFCATTAGDPNPGWGITDPYQTVWFKFNSGSAGRDIKIDAYNDPASLGDQIDLKLALYGGTCGSQTLIDKDYDVLLYDETMEGEYCLIPNTDYYILVSGSNFDFATGSTKEGFFGLTVKDNGPYPGNDLICNIASVTTYNIGTAATVATNVGTVNNISKAGTNIKGTNCFDPNPTWGGACAAAFSNDNDYGVWYKLPAAANRKDILIKGVSSGDVTDLQYALYEASAPTNCTTPGATLVTNSYYGALAWNSAAGLCASADEDHIYTCLDPAKDYYLMVDGNSQLISCGTGNFTLNTYYPKEGGILPCSAEQISAATSVAGWTGSHKIDLAANFCGTPGGHASAPSAPWGAYQKPVWWKFVAPVSGSVQIRVKSDSTNLGDELRPRPWVFEENTPGVCSNTALSNSNIDQKDPDDLLGTGDPDVFTEILDVRCLVPGQTYYLVTDGIQTIAEVCGSGTRVGFFSLEIKDLGQPKRPNDNICGATPGVVAGDPYYFTPSAAWKTVNKEAELTKTNQDNYCFVINNEPDATNWGGTWATTNNVRGGWYSFRAPPSGKVEIELNNKSLTSDQIDAQIAVYKIKPGFTCSDVQVAPSINNPALSPLEFLGSSNDTYAGFLADEDLTVTCLVPDDLYYIYIEGVNSNTLGINDLGTGEFNLLIRSDPRDPAAKNDTKCNPIYLGQPANTIGSTINIINAESCGNFNRNVSGSSGGVPTLGTHGVTLTKATNNHGGTIAGEVALSCAPNPGCIDDISSVYDRSLYPFNNFCATAVGDSTPANWGALFGAVDAKPRKSVWFMFKAPADLDGNGEEAVKIELNQEIISLNPNKDGLDLRGSVFESSDNTCNGNFYDIKSEYDAGSFDEDFNVSCLEPNRYYWLMVDGSSLNDEGYFGIKISRVTPDPRPNNDYICSAYTLANTFFGAGGPVSRAKDFNICARVTRTAVDPTSENVPTGFGLDHTVWYKVTTPATPGDYAVKVDVNGWGPGLFGYTDKMDPQIAIYESQDGSCNWGTGGANMVEIASEYDILPFTESMIGYCMQPSKTYYIMVDGSAVNSQGYFDISINDVTPITPFPSAPLNYDLFANAVSLTMPTTAGAGGATTSALAHNYCTGIEAGEPDSWTLYDIDNTVWWKFTVPTTGIYNNQHVDMTIRLKSDPGSVKNDGINLLGAVYELNGAATFANLTNIATGTNILLYDEDITISCLTPGKTYYLQVDGYSGPLNIFRAQGQGYYKVELETTTLIPNQGNDSVCGAIQIPIHATNYYPTSGLPYNNICKTTQANENLPWVNADSKTVWFKFIPPASGNVTIDVQSQAGDNIGAQLAVYQSLIPVASSACPPINQLVLSGKEYDPLGYGETMTIKCLDNQYWHYLQVNSENIGIWREGTFKINIKDIGGATNPPYNDNICNARDFGNITNANGTGGFARVGDSNKCASIQISEPNTISNPGSDIQRSVWYKFTAPTSGRARITLHDQDGYLSGIDPEMKLYEGTVTGCPSASPTFTSFVELESAYNPLPNFPSSTTGDEVIEYECFIPGTVYYIQVDGTTVGGPQGFFDIKIEDLIPNYALSSKKPANDEPASATNLTVNNEQCAVPIGATSVGDELQGNGTWLTGNYKKPTITKKDVLGACNTLDNCGDIWYKFTMPNDDCMLGSVVAIQGYSDQVAVGSAYHNDLKIFAYRGAPGSFTPIDCGYTDNNPLTADYFHFEIAGTAGETIYLQVFDQNYNDQDNDDEEDFFICVSKRFGVDKCQNLANVPFMEYEKDYCWNIEGASGETPASAYGETNSALNATENSAYFKFKMTNSPCDSIKFTIWQPTPPNLFLQGGGINSNQIVSLSIYREDNMLCDGTIDGALVSKSYICSSPTAILDNTLSFNVGISNLDTNKVYVVQIDGEGQDETGYINNGFIRIDTIQRCVNVQAVTYNDTSTSYWKCTDGWRYYHDRNNVIIFALHPNGNNFEGVAKIRYKPTYDSETSCAASMAEYSMRRIWDYQITSGSINPLQPVKVRFYYIAAEKTAIINAALAFKSSCGGFYEPFEWFKTASGIQYIPTVPDQINPARITAGYSETSCLGSPLFGSPNGCFNLTATDNQYSCNGTLYVELGAIVGFSGGTGAAGVGPWDGASPLPVELISFTGYNNGTVNVLDWSTASEINTLKFEVERRTLTSTGFTYIGEKPAAGNSSTILNYTINDESPTIGDNYYRLKMIDVDGTYEYSQTIVIKNNDNSILNDVISNIYPNPTNQTLYIDYQSSTNSNIKLSIYDALGQEMMINNLNTVKGNQQFKLDVNSLANGVYIIHIQDVKSGKILQTKFVKE